MALPQFAGPGTCILCGIPAVSSQDAICNYCLRIALEVMQNQAFTSSNIMAYLDWQAMAIRQAASSTQMPASNPGKGTAAAVVVIPPIGSPTHS